MTREKRVEERGRYSSRKALVICVNATALSIGVTGISPQSSTFAQLEYGLILALGLKPLKEVCLADAALMAFGPKRAPGR
jgi:hypothetical protein